MPGDKQDRRVQKTRMALHQALISLMRTQKYDAILVQDILDHANVGRSTFYSHFRDKDELLLGGMDHLREFLNVAQQEAKQGVTHRYETVIGFSGAMFAHAGENRDVYHSLLGGVGWVIVSRGMEEILMQLVSKEAKPLYQAGPPPALPFELFVHFIVTTFWSVMTWWISQRNAMPAQTVDTHFRSLVLPAMAVRLR